MVNLTAGPEYLVACLSVRWSWLAAVVLHVAPSGVVVVVAVAVVVVAVVAVVVGCVERGNVTAGFLRGAADLPFDLPVEMNLNVNIQHGLLQMKGWYRLIFH